MVAFAETQPSSLAFGTENVGASTASKPIILSNTGTARMSITSLGIVGTNAGDFTQSNTCGTSLAAGAKCTISVSFRPTAAGPRRSSISISDNAGGSPQRVILTGVGAAVSLSPTSLGFGSQTVGTSSSPQSVTITNKGSTMIHLWQIAIIGTNAGDFSKTTTCGSTLAAAANCSVSVTFKPKATGARNASLLFSDDGGGSPQAVGLTGTGM